MSHRITIEHARELQRNESEKRSMIKSGVRYHSRRNKKYELTRRKQDGILWRMKDRIIKTKGKMPKHLKNIKEVVS
jgi:transposase